MPLLNYTTTVTVQRSLMVIDQVLLPYMLVDVDGTTVFELYASGAQPALEAG